MAKPKSTRKQESRGKPAPAELSTTSPASFTLAALTAALGVKGKAAWNILSSLGPRALTLFRGGSTNLLRHQLGKDAISGWKEALTRENEDFAEVEQAIVKRIPTAKPEEFVEIQQRLEFVRSLRCQGSIAGKALAYLSDKPSVPLLTPPGTSSSSEGEAAEIIGDHWMDHFNRLARQRNEPWREQLLARALALEAEAPGTVSPRLLWLLGTLEVEKFECVSALLDLSIIAGGEPLVAGSEVRATKVFFNERTLPIGALTVRLSDVGLVEEPDVVKVFESGNSFEALYETQVFQVTSLGDGQITGIFFTSLGRALAMLYDPSPNDTGRALFNAWRDELLTSGFLVVPGEPSSSISQARK